MHYPARLWYTMIKEFGLKNVGHVFLTTPLIVFLSPFLCSEKFKAQDYPENTHCSL